MKFHEPVIDEHKEQEISFNGISLSRNYNFLYTLIFKYKILSRYQRRFNVNKITLMSLLKHCTRFFNL